MRTSGACINSKSMKKIVVPESELEHFLLKNIFARPLFPKNNAEPFDETIRTEEIWA